MDGGVVPSHRILKRQTNARCDDHSHHTAFKYFAVDNLSAHSSYNVVVTKQEQGLRRDDLVQIAFDWLLCKRRALDRLQGIRLHTGAGRIPEREGTVIYKMDKYPL